MYNFYLIVSADESSALDGTFDRFLTSVAGHNVVRVVCIARGWRPSTVAAVLAWHRVQITIIEAPAELSASNARNLGLQALADGEVVPGAIIAFPDDDCWYLGDTLDHVAEAFDDRPDADGVTGRYGPSRDRLDRERFPDTPADLDVRQALRRITCVTLFLRIEVAMALGGFNPALGGGTPLLAGEDTDYAIRLVQAGTKVAYLPSVVIGHPYKQRPDSYAGVYPLVLASHVRTMPQLWPLLVRALLGGVVKRRRLQTLAFLRPELLRRVANERANIRPFVGTNEHRA